MSYEVVIHKKVEKFLVKLHKERPKEHFKIRFFINEKLSKLDNPCTLLNAKYLQGYSDNRYRWRLGAYRIIGIVKNKEFKIIQIIKIDKRDGKTYKNL